MTSHADILREAAKDQSVADVYIRADALLAGADALDTLTKVRDVLDRLEAQPRPEDVPAGERAMEEQTNEVDHGWIYHGDTERTHLPDGTTVRRFVTDWEEQA